MHIENQERLKVGFAGAVFISLASLVSINMIGNDFKISIAIVFMPVFAYLLEDFSPLLCGLFASFGVYALRIGVYGFLGAGFKEAAASYWPEVLFYCVYGLLLHFLIIKRGSKPLRFSLLFFLVPIDFFSNMVELYARMGAAAFQRDVALNLLVVAAGRSLIAAAVCKAFDFYGLTLLKKEDSKRYNRLVLLTSMLNSEYRWLKKSAGKIEDTMDAAYGLYMDLKDTMLGEKALVIAKDIHEVKKEYLLILRGLSDSATGLAMDDKMKLSQVFSVLRESYGDFANVAFSFYLEKDFYTDVHYYLLSIFNNLFANAVEAADGSRREVSVTEKSQKDCWQFIVADNCGGIDEKYLESIFLPGFSTKINEQSGELNRGLGLSIVEEIVTEKLGGTITVCSKEGVTAFDITIPRHVLEGS